MSKTTIPFPWYVLVNDEGELLVLFTEESLETQHFVHEGRVIAAYRRI